MVEGEGGHLVGAGTGHREPLELVMLDQSGYRQQSLACQEKTHLSLYNSRMTASPGVLPALVAAAVVVTPEHGGSPQGPGQPGRRGQEGGGLGAGQHAEQHQGQHCVWSGQGY